ncbi:MAG: hypothetical protein JNM62_08770 [Flavobacteriales bacterium]|nr:hypothetical protein [Flavobacteriales bacterium]
MRFSRCFSPARFGAVLAVLLALTAQAQQSRFDIWKGNDIVGSILAKRVVDGERTQYLMTSYSAFDIVWKQEVSSLVSTEYRNGELSKCHSNMTVNGNMRDSSHYAAKGEGASCYVHPDERFLHEGRVEWTTARMYFEEPVGQRSIFVESVLKHCPLTHLGDGRYRLVLPDDKVNVYAYRDGRLEEIHVDRNLVDLVFKRDS